VRLQGHQAAMACLRHVLLLLLLWMLWWGCLLLV
jgi:hypothetical protein